MYSRTIYAIINGATIIISKVRLITLAVYNGIEQLCFNYEIASVPIARTLTQTPLLKLFFIVHRISTDTRETCSEI